MARLRHFPDLPQVLTHALPLLWRQADLIHEPRERRACRMDMPQPGLGALLGDGRPEALVTAAPRAGAIIEALPIPAHRAQHDHVGHSRWIFPPPTKVRFTRPFTGIWFGCMGTLANFLQVSKDARSPALGAPLAQVMVNVTWP